MKQIKAVSSTVNKVGKVQVLQQHIFIDGQSFDFEVDTGAGESSMEQSVWQQLGVPELTESTQKIQSASQHPLPVLGSVTISAQKTSLVGGEESQKLEFNVAEQPQLNLLGWNAIQELEVSVESLMHRNIVTVCVFDDITPDNKIQEVCVKLCEEFPDVFKPEL